MHEVVREESVDFHLVFVRVPLSSQAGGFWREYCCLCLAAPHSSVSCAEFHALTEAWLGFLNRVAGGPSGPGVGELGAFELVERLAGLVVSLSTCNRVVAGSKPG